MTISEAEFVAPSRAVRWQFDRYVLDLDRGCLLLDGAEIALRPKTFAVLHYLVANPGRLVAKDELFGAVWPNLAVTDDVLVQSIGELRRAFGDDGPRLVRTIPRRGYRFEGAVSPVAAVDPSVRQPAPAASGRGSAHVPEPAIPARPPTWLATRLAAGPRWFFAALALVAVLAGGLLWLPQAPVGTSQDSAGASPPSAATVDAGDKPAVAILPFLDQGGDPSRAYYVDGLTQDIINALGRFSALTVMSWNAVRPYKGKPARPADIARSLAVRYQVEGSARIAGERVRVNAQLVDADGRVLWSARFDEALADVFALPDKITTQIAGALAIHVSQAEQRRVFAKPTASLEAYDYVLRARPALQHPARADIVTARQLLKRAIGLDPKYASAYAALGETDYIAVSMGWAESPTAALSRAAEMSNKALSLNTSQLRAYVILGRIDLFYHRYQQAKAEMDAAIAINPSDPNALAGRGNVLMWLGQTDAALAALELAQRIDPELNAIDRFALSLAYYLKGRYDAAIAQAQLNLRETAGANFSRIVLAAAYAEQDRPDDAARTVMLIARLDPTFDPETFGSKLLKSGDLEHLRDGLRKAGLYSPRADRTTH